MNELNATLFANLFGTAMNEVIEKFLLAKMEEMLATKLVTLEIHTLEMRLNMAYQEIDRLQRVLGVESVESGREVLVGRDVLTRLDDLDGRLYGHVVEAIEESRDVQRVVERMVEKQLEEQDFAQMFRDNFDISAYEAEINDLIDGALKDRVVEALSGASLSITID